MLRTAARRRNPEGTCGSIANPSPSVDRDKRLIVLSATIGHSKGIELTVLLLHGYAMRAEDLLPFARSMAVPGRFHCPQAPHFLPAGGLAWWPVDEFSRHDALARGPRDLVDEYPPLRAQARARLATWLQDPVLCPPSAPLVLAGFSQGGMLACDTVLQEGVSVDGLVLLSSSRMAIAEWQLRRTRLKGLRVLVAHGMSDPDLSYSAGERLRDWLQDAGAKVQWLPFEGGHQIPLPVWRQFRDFLRSFGPSREIPRELHS